MKIGNPWEGGPSRTGSYLQFHQPVGGLGQDGKSRKLAFHHRDLVAIVITRTYAAIFVDLVGQVFSLRGIKSKLGKKLRAAREQANATDLMFVRLGHQGLNQQFTAAALLKGTIHRDGTNL